MKMETQKRIQYLEKFIAYEDGVMLASKRLSILPWDSDDELVVLKRRQITSMLQRYLEGELSAQEVEDWADAIEGREDIGYEVSYEGLVLQAIIDLANPILSEQLTPQFAQEWIEKLR